MPSDDLAVHIVQAVDCRCPLLFMWCFTNTVSGFFKSILLRNVDALQDTLRLLTLWFKYGAHDDVSHAMSTGFTNVKIDTWLEVIPQIIARIQTPSSNIRRNINHLLADVGRHHPQALIYPLTVAAKSSSTPRRSAAQAIMDRMREHSPVIVDQVSYHHVLYLHMSDHILLGYGRQSRAHSSSYPVARNVARGS